MDERPVVAARVEELPSALKPCYVKDRGIDRGSYMRTHDGDRALTSYEVHALLASRGQPNDDHVVAVEATVADLDADLVATLLRRLRSTRSFFEKFSDEDVLNMVGVLRFSGDRPRPTVGGLMALGRYPQQFYPQLNTTFVSYPTIDGTALADGTRFLDNQAIDGPIPIQVATALGVLRRNLARRSVISGLGREDRWEYPQEALREVIANALMHRDYHPLAHGTQVRIELFPDRLEVSNPGGLYGSIAPEDLLAESVSSSRNAYLAKLLEDVEVQGTGRTVCENRGSGLLAAAAALRHAGIEPPQVATSAREFRITIRNHGLLDERALAFIATVDTSGLNDSQRLALAFAHRHGKITNQQYRTISGADSLTATRDLTALGTRGLFTKVSDRRWTVWVMNDTQLRRQLTLEFDAPERHVIDRRLRRSREQEIVVLLSAGPMTAIAIANSLRISRQGTLSWLKRLEQDGVVVATASKKSSPNNMWRLSTPIPNTSRRPTLG